MALFEFETKLEKRIREEGIIAVTKAPEIIKKYDRLREKVVQNNNPKHIKVTDKKLKKLYTDKEIDITTLIVNCLDISDQVRDIIDNVKEQLKYHIYFNCDRAMQLIEGLEAISHIITEKFQDVIKDKDFSKDTVYFSNLEHICIEEIYELILEYEETIYLIIEEIERLGKKIEKTKIENNEFWLKELEEIQEEIAHCNQIYYEKDYLLWIFREYD